MADFRTRSGKRAATGCADVVLPPGVVPAALVSLTTVGWTQLLVAGGALGLPRGPRRGALGTRPNFQELRVCELRLRIVLGSVAFVAWIRSKRLRLATSELPE